MQTQIFRSPDIFETLSPEWLELLEHAAVNHVFMTPQFLKSWWQTLGEGELLILTVRDELNKLVGVAPFFYKKNELGKTELNFVGCKAVSDYLDCIVDARQQAAVYQEIFKTLTQNFTSWENLELCSIPHNSPTLETFKDFAQKNSWQFTQTQQDVCPIIQLPKTWDEYLTGLDKKQRHEIKRKWQKLENEAPSARFVLITDFTAIEKDISDFIQLHQHSSEDKKSFWDEKHVEFFQKFALHSAEKNWLRLFFLEIEGERVASMLGFEYNNQFFLYNSGFAAEKYRHLSVGNVLTSFTLKHAIEAGNTVYDFLRGDEEYKFRYRAVAQPIFDISITRG